MTESKYRENEIPNYLQVLCFLVFIGHCVGIFWLNSNEPSMAEGVATLYSSFTKYGIRSSNNTLVTFSNNRPGENTICESHDIANLPLARQSGGVVYAEGDYYKKNNISINGKVDGVEIRGIYNIKQVKGLTYNLIVLFELFTVIIALCRAVAIHWSQQYKQLILDDQVFILYYVEYSITAGLLAAAVATLHGIRDENILWAIGGALFVCNVLGIASDLEFTKTDIYIPLAAFYHIAAWVPLVYVLNLIYGTFTNYNEVCPQYTFHIPGFVRTIMWVEFALFASFGAVSVLANISRYYYKESDDKAKRGVRVAVAFEILSIAAKLSFVFVVGAGSNAL
jgi:hypothetical protein